MIVLYLAIVGSLQLVAIWLIVKLREDVMDFQKRYMKISDLELDLFRNIAVSMDNQRNAINHLGDATKTLSGAILRYVKQTEGD